MRRGSVEVNTIIFPENNFREECLCESIPFLVKLFKLDTPIRSEMFLFVTWKNYFILEFTWTVVVSIFPAW